MTESARAPQAPAEFARWVREQRWYAGKGRSSALSIVGSFVLPCDQDDVRCETLLLRDDTGGIYQVPLTFRAGPLDGPEAAVVPGLSRLPGSERSEPSATADQDASFVYDGPHDPAYATALLALVASGGTSTHGQYGAARAAGHLHPAALPGAADGVRSTRVLSGEQSNTSIVYETAAGSGAPPLIVKVFRTLHDGDNPEVTLQSALAAAGSQLVPSPVGHVVGAWPDGRTSSGIGAGHLAFAQEFFPGVQDAWREALAAVGAGTDWSRTARSLGEATAEVHTTLAEALPTTVASTREIDAVLAGMRSRHAAAVHEVPALAQYDDAVEAILGHAETAPWPSLQRIHGDYHLGQVLDVPGRGWVLLDFEGEPLRPLAERSRPDVTWRDVAGMLRSFDYVAGSFQQERAGESAQTWADAARAGFLEGYASRSGRDIASGQALLDAFELDKALYEVVYESHNRPDWLPIPTTAISRLAAAQIAKENAVTPTVPKRQPQPQPASAVPVDTAELRRLVAGTHHNPHGILGPHPHDAGVTVRVLKPMARAVSAVLPDESEHAFTHEHEGVWVAVLPVAAVPDYRLIVAYEDGFPHRQDDPYRFLPTLGEVDVHLISEGRHEQLWTVLGAHVREYDGPMGAVQGTSFAVWAPNARAIRLVGDLNHWDNSTHPMRSLGSSGIWELFVPGVGDGSRYKFDILGSDGHWRTKADPMARATEIPPSTASVVTASAYQWGDQDWLEQRASNNVHNGPMSTYEVHLGSWRQGSSYQDLAEHLVNYVSDLGFTHVEFLPVMEHPYGPSWGYQVTGYYAPTSRFGPPDDFRLLVDTLHQHGIGVILDWVPGHFPKDSFALARFDGEALYEHPDPRRGDQPDWGTHVFDFGRPQVRNFLVANAVYWMQEFHVDGLRVDAVASMLYLDYSRKDGQWVPNIYGGREHLEAVQLLQETNATVYRREPGVVMIAEESTSWPGVTRPTHLGGLGFGLKWNMGWMHDTLAYVEQPPIYRQYHHHQMTFSMVYAYSENFVLPVSHDEVVYGKGSLLRKMPGDRWNQLANLRAYLAFMWSHPGKQLIFMGCEFGQESEWADGRSLDWWLLDQPAHWGVHSLVKELNRVYRDRPALWALDHAPAGFSWIDANDSMGNTLSYLRYGPPQDGGGRPVVASVVNFSGVPNYDYRIGLPHPGRWNEILNTDAEFYGGSGVGNLGSVTAEETPWHGQPFSASITVPPTAAVWFEPDSAPAPSSAEPKAARLTDRGDHALAGRGYAPTGPDTAAEGPAVAGSDAASGDAPEQTPDFEADEAKDPTKGSRS